MMISPVRRQPACLPRILAAVSVAMVFGGCAIQTPGIALDDLRARAEAGNPVAQFELGQSYLVDNGTGTDPKIGALWIEKAAINEHRDAQYLLGYLYAEGIGVARDQVTSASWLEAAALKQHSVAQNSLGEAYRDGRGVAKNDSTAILWIRRAAAQNLPEANLNLARMYEQGRGVSRDETRAAELYRGAASQGNAEAGFRLGVLFEQGRGVVEDVDEALRWYGIAASEGNAEAELRMNKILAENDETSNRPSPFEAAVSAAERGSPRAQLALGFKYEQGLGVSKDVAEALRWYREAASQGNAEAEVRISRLEGRSGQVVSRPSPFDEMKRAAEQGDSEAQRALGFKYERGLGVESDLSLALEWYEKAASQGNPTAKLRMNMLLAENREPVEQLTSLEISQRSAAEGDPEAQFLLALRYEQARGIPTDLGEALHWYEEAASQGHAAAQLRITSILADQGRMEEADFFAWAKREASGGESEAQYAVAQRYEAGNGVEKDLDQALIWYHSAADGGSAKAQRALGEMYDEGRGVEQDSDEALRWYEKAANQGNADTRLRVAESLDDDAEQIIGGPSPFEVTTRAAESGEAEAQFALGLAYELGSGVSADAQIASEWYSAAADQGHAPAQTALGVMYMIGAGVDRNDSQAMIWFQRAADQGEAGGQFYLGLMVLGGEKTSKSKGR
jgi:TPR repeat protein